MTVPIQMFIGVKEPLQFTPLPILLVHKPNPFGWAATNPFGWAVPKVTLPRAFQMRKGVKDGVVGVRAFGLRPEGNLGFPYLDIDRIHKRQSLLLLMKIV